jgi:hypothetical protein
MWLAYLLQITVEAYDSDLNTNLNTNLYTYLYG